MAKNLSIYEGHHSYIVHHHSLIVFKVLKLVLIERLITLTLVQSTRINVGNEHLIWFYSVSYSTFNELVDGFVFSPKRILNQLNLKIRDAISREQISETKKETKGMM